MDWIAAKMGLLLGIRSMSTEVVALSYRHLAVRVLFCVGQEKTLYD